MGLNPHEYIIEIKCDICGTVCGSVTLHSDHRPEENTTYDDLGIADHRCATCEYDHGSFKELCDDVAKVVEDPLEAERLVKIDRTATKVLTRMKKHKNFKKVVQFRNAVLDSELRKVREI